MDLFDLSILLIIDRIDLIDLFRFRIDSKFSKSSSQGNRTTLAKVNLGNSASNHDGRNLDVLKNCSIVNSD